MDAENKLDQDFLFYLGFTNSWFRELQNTEDIERCRAWLQKLCGEACNSVDEKRNRNIYLSNLVLCMQEGKLTEPFLKPPHEVDISNALQIFEHLPDSTVPPDWLQGHDEAADDDDDSRDGRTYLATRTLPGGEGAFAYLAVTLAEDEPKWLGGQEGLFDKAMEQKFKEFVPPVSEMEKILLRRKDPAQRERVLSFYDALIQNINKELEDEVQPVENETVNGLIVQLMSDLQKKNSFEPYKQMSPKQRRTELLLMLHERIYARREKIAQREEILDDLEESTMPQSFFDVSVQEQDKIELPAAMWEQAINKQPNKKNMDALFNNYPHLLIEKFLDLLSNEKEEIAMRMQRRHQNIVGQMRKELRKEGEKNRAKAEEADRACAQASPVLESVKAAYTKQVEALKRAADRKKTDVTEQGQLYEQLRAALFDTQKSVEQEAERGRMLTDQINCLNEQTAVYQKVNDDSIRKAEAANIGLMRNIKKLRNAVKQHEARVVQIQAMSSQTQGKSSQQFFMY